MSPPQARHLSVAVFADTDSRWKWGQATALTLRPSRITYFLKDGPASPSLRQLQESGVDPAQVITTNVCGFADALSNHDVAVLALPGDGCQAVMHAIAAHGSTSRPVLVTGYVGVVYEKIVEGVLLRAGADVILANSPADADRFRQILTEQGLPGDSVIFTPLPFLTAVAPQEMPGPFTLTFAAQPDVPSGRRDREYLVERLNRHARLHPERQVVLKVRGLPGEHLTHPEPYPYPRLLDRLRDRAPNLEVLAGSMTEILPRTSLLATVSSTAAVEAVHAGIPTAVLTDFGVREGLGNPYFSGSGCLVSFDELDAGALPGAEPGWAERNGMVHGSPAAFLDRVAHLVAAGREPLRLYYTAGHSPAYLPRLLAGHGLTPEGRPRPAPRHHLPRLRRLARSVIHALYRHGANVVAPALRKWGSA